MRKYIIDKINWTLNGFGFENVQNEDEIMFLFMNELDLLNCFSCFLDDFKCKGCYDYLLNTFIPLKASKLYGVDKHVLSSIYNVNFKTLKKYEIHFWNPKSIFPKMNGLFLGKVKSLKKIEK